MMKICVQCESYFKAANSDEDLCPICRRQGGMRKANHPSPKLAAKQLSGEKGRRFFSMKWRFGLIFGFFLLMTFLLLFYTINSVFRNHAAAELQSRAMTVARSFVTSGTTLVLGDKMDLLNKLIREMFNLDPDIVYIMADLPNKTIVSHKLPDGMPAHLLKKPPAPEGQEPGVAYFRTSAFGIREAVLPILGQHGVVRVGLSDQRIMNNLDKSQILILLVMAAALLVGTLISVYLIRHLTKPVIRLAKAVDDISMGQVDVTIPTLKFNDEIHLLAQAFERLRVSFKIAMDKISDSG